MKKFYLFWLFSLLYFELILKFSVFNSVFNSGFIFFILFLFCYSVFFYFITNIFEKKINKILSYGILIFLTFVFSAQIVYYQSFESFFSFYSVGKAMQIFEFFDTILKMILQNIMFLFLLFVPLLLFIFFNKYFNFEKKSLEYSVLVFFFFIIFLIISIGSLELVQDKEKYSSKELYYNLYSPTLSVNNLGLVTTMRLDLKRTFFGFEENSDLVPINQNNVDKEKNQKKEKNIIDIDFDNLIKNELDSEVKNMHEYFSFLPGTEKNKYTGIFKGKNLIFILAESLHPIAIDKELTPTLYKMVNSSFVFNNYYVPIFPVSTSDGEYIANTSLLPKEGIWSAYRSYKNFFPFTFGNVFKKMGYKSLSYHNNVGTYYNRYKSHPNFGYDFYACGSGLNINCKIWPQSDLEMIEASYENFINEDKFLTYYITVSGHLRYTKTGNMMTVKNWDHVKDLKYSNSLKSYLACNIELEKAIERLFEILEEKDLLDDTVIVLTNDHYPYGLNLDEINEKANPKISEPFEIHRSNLIIYNSEIKRTEIDKYSSHLDILPTVLNLFGINYDSRFLMGKDIFSNDEGLVIFSNRSFITDKGVYDSIKNKFNPFNENVNDEYINNYKKIIYDKFNLSNKIFENDYYNKVFK